MGQSLQRAVPPGVIPLLSTPGSPSYFPVVDSYDGTMMELDQLSQLDDLDHELNDPHDIGQLPPELAINILSHLDATDLCLAACVWQQLAGDNILWHSLCRERWTYTSLYHQPSPQPRSYRQLYLQMDEGTLTFNSDADQGMQYFISRGIVKDEPKEIAKFVNGTTAFSKTQVRHYLESRQDIVDCMVSLQNFANSFLPTALRRFFAKLEAPEDLGAYIQKLLEKFSVRFCQCNPSLGMSVDTVYVICFSLILLSVDLTSPHVKNKMSKREFIRNTRGAVRAEQNALDRAPADDDLFGQLYDNVFIRGHIADQSEVKFGQTRQFVPGYLALFL